MMEQLNDYKVAFTGASTSVYGERMSGFSRSVKEYQTALLAYRDAKLAGAPNQGQLKQRAHRAFQVMQKSFRAELTGVTNHIRSRRGTPLTSVERGINIARSSRNTAKLQFANEVEAHKLVRFSQYTKVLGNGLAVIDFGSRAGKVHNSYQAGGDWERDLFIESSSFAAGATSGLITAKVGSAALLFVMALTPAGWAGLILVAGGTMVAATSAGATLYATNKAQNNAGSVYDKILNWMN